MGEMPCLRLGIVVSINPLPVDSGDHVRVIELIDAILAASPQHYQVKVHLYIVARANDAQQALPQLQERFPAAATIDVFNRGSTPQPGIFRRVASRAISITLGIPPWIAKRHSSALVAALQASRDAHDEVWLLGEASGTYANVVGRAVWDKSNVLTASTRTALFAARNPKTVVFAALNHLASLRYEKRVSRYVQRVMFTSAEELSRWEALRLNHLSQGLAVLASTVPTAPQVSISDLRREIVWLGSFDYDPNVEGLLRFLKASSASFQASGTRLRLIGAHCNAALEQTLRAFPHVDFVGFAENLGDALTGSTAAVVPIWRGAGIKMKTLTLLAHGVPVFSTTCGAEGIPESFFSGVADDASALSQLCSDFSLTHDARTLAAHRRELVQQGFSSGAMQASVNSLLDVAVKNLGRVAPGTRQ